MAATRIVPASVEEQTVIRFADGEEIARSPDQFAQLVAWIVERICKDCPVLKP